VQDDGKRAGDPPTEGYLPASSGKEAGYSAGKNQKRKERKEEVSDAKNSWSAKDLERITLEGLSVEEIERQLALFRQGISPIRLNRPCRAGDGIVILSKAQQDEHISVYEEGLRTKRFMKFVPASGAASRMFKEWHRYLQEGGFATEAEREAFVHDLKKYAFFHDLTFIALAKGQDIEALIRKKADRDLLWYILTEEGLNYGRLPKALLKFHRYPEGSRTALEEHLVEAVLYARDVRKCARIHFTVSAEHEHAVRDRLERVIGDYQTRLDTVLEVGLSTQETVTNTIAVDPECRPFRDESGGLVFRPGGHGALLKNLNGLDSDIVFLKNIDNCVPDRLKPETVRWKKILAGHLITLQEGIFRRLRLLTARDARDGDLTEIAAFCREKLHLSLPPGFFMRPPAERRSFLFGELNRPLRVCGMVKNEGEPGGGPFWVDHSGGEGALSLQIIEESQVDRNDPFQKKIWQSSTHFNPVDLVCGIRDYRGHPFDLFRFVDQAQSTISSKSEQGRELLALERPGLWNGSMAYWNTLFVETPLAAFNPVKTIRDLLRPQHLSL
jgi:hypothetical protein